MDDLLNLKKKLDSFDVPEEIFNILDKNSEKLFALQKSQMEQGKDSKGKVIGSYKPATFEKARKQRPIKSKIPGNPWNLQWSGAMFSDMYFRKLNNMLEIDSSSSTKSGLNKTIQKHGNKGVTPQSIWGLDEKNKDTLNYEILMPELIKALNETIL